MSSESKPPAQKVVISEKVYQKIMHWVNKSNFEVSGFGTVSFDKTTETFTIHDAVLLKQENTATSTEIDPVSLGKAMYELKDAPGELKWWWHSHADMGVFWSGDDMKVIDELGGNGWILATVFNKRQQQRSAFMTKFDTIVGNYQVFIDDMALLRVQPILEEEKNEWDAEYERHVTEKKWKAQTPTEETKEGPYQPSLITGTTGTSGRHLEDDIDFEDRIYDREDPYYSKSKYYFWRSGYENVRTGDWTPGQWFLKGEFAHTRNRHLEEIEANQQILDDLGGA